jgi:hypothetical protein
MPLLLEAETEALESNRLQIDFLLVNEEDVMAVPRYPELQLELQPGIKCYPRTTDTTDFPT